MPCATPPCCCPATTTGLTTRPPSSTEAQHIHFSGLDVTSTTPPRGLLRGTWAPPAPRRLRHPTRHTGTARAPPPGGHHGWSGGHRLPGDRPTRAAGHGESTVPRRGDVLSRGFKQLGGDGARLLAPVAGDNAAPPSPGASTPIRCRSRRNAAVSDGIATPTRAARRAARKAGVPTWWRGPGRGRRCRPAQLPRAVPRWCGGRWRHTPRDGCWG